MLVVMQSDATPRDVDAVADVVRELGYEPVVIDGAQRSVVAIVGNETRVDTARLTTLGGVRDIVHLTDPYRAASRESKSGDTIVRLPGGLTIGGTDIQLIAGPCAVESLSQIVETAHAVREAGATMLRGGAFKPRTSPYSFQGLGVEGLRHLARAREETGLLVVTEAVDPNGVDAVEEYADVIQIGARNMQNFSLLKRVGRAGKPVLLKRGMSATLTEWLLSAEYVLAEGNANIILCERGVRGFDPRTRNVLDLSAVPLAKRMSHLPVVVDPSHATGSRDLVPSMTLGAVAAGADAIMVEVHNHPERALSDAAQSLYPEQFRDLVTKIRAVASAVGRRIAEPVPAPVGS